MRSHRFRQVAGSLLSTAILTLCSTAPPRALGQVTPAGGATTLEANLAEQLGAFDSRIAALRKSGRFTEAIQPAASKLALLERTRGKDHWATREALVNLETLRMVSTQTRERQDQFAKSWRADAQGELAYALGQYAWASRLFEEIAETRRVILGEKHPDTATGLGDLAVTLFARGMYSEAESLQRRALPTIIEALGEDNPRTAIARNNLGDTLRGRGKFNESESLQRIAVANIIKARGEFYPDTGACYNNLASTLLALGRYGEAEIMQRRSLYIWIRILGENHADTAKGYTNLAAILVMEGKLAESEAALRQAMAILLKARGMSHVEYATAVMSLSVVARMQGNLAEAEKVARLASDTLAKALGENHSTTATCLLNLADILKERGDYFEAEKMARRALSIMIEASGEGSYTVAKFYLGLSVILRAKGDPAESEALARRALAILEKALGEGHHETGRSLEELAWSLEAQRKPDAALKIWELAVASYEKARLRTPKGLESAYEIARSPLTSLALALARAGEPAEAWARWEKGLARSLLDEITGRDTRPLDPQERLRESELLGQAQATDDRIEKLRALRAPSEEQAKILNDLRLQQSDLRRRLLELEQAFEKKYAVLAGDHATLEATQKALRDDTALVGWIDEGISHWACILRHSGDPIWIALKGTADDGTWTNQDVNLTHLIRAEFEPNSTKGNARTLAEALAQQRLTPLKEQLAGIRRLIVVNSPGMAGVPIEALMASRPDPGWDGITISYTPSASMHVYLAAKPTIRDRDATILTLADPAYPIFDPHKPEPAPPEKGIAITGVQSNGNADLNGIRKGDVLLAYNEMKLARPQDLKIIPADGGPRKVPIAYWRDGITREVEVAAGPLGISIDPRPAGEFVLANRQAEQILLGMRGGSHARLPATRREVEAIGRLFPAGGVTQELGEEACESTIQGMATSGKLKGFRYLHFATHGESDARFAYRTALILAPDPGKSDDPLALDTDGKITAEQIARTWELDADLVVLSSCESGLGLAAGGEGYLGFAQPLFAKGARSLILSLWKVDDDATALLMTRFYQNLLGKRPGLAAAMPKAEALSEAKRWLRDASAEEVGRALDSLPRGEIIRREVVAAKPRVKPYEDPTYWAGFILVGAPD